MKALVFFPLFFLPFAARPSTGPSCDLAVLEQIDKQTPSKETLRVDRLVVNKAKGRLFLMSNGQVVKEYFVAMGIPGPKMFEGDGKTPEGTYRIEFHNKESVFHKSLKISYPNSGDRKRAEAAGKKPGGDIMIHGFPTDYWKNVGVALVHPGNWTTGCIAVTDREIDEIFELVRDGLAIDICAGPPRPVPPVRPTPPKPGEPAPVPGQPATPPSDPIAPVAPEPLPWYWL